MIKPYKIWYLLIVFSIVLYGCASGVGVREASDEEYLAYTSFRGYGEEFSVVTGNLLGNYLFIEKIGKEVPEKIISDLEVLAEKEARSEFHLAIAELSLSLSRKMADDPDRQARFYLTTLLHIFRYFEISGRHVMIMSQSQLRMFTSYNQALAGLFEYLSRKEIVFNSAYELKAAGGQIIAFDVPESNLPLPLTKLKNIRPCAGLRPVNLTHNARNFGIGVPLVCYVNMNVFKDDPALSELRTIPGTLLLEFISGVWNGKTGRSRVRLCFVDSAKNDFIFFNNIYIPLEQDFSIPLAAMIKPESAGYDILRTFIPERSVNNGLYLLSHRDDQRIPVLLVHGLMSDLKTWLQLMNTLQSDPYLRKHYRFMGFSYSSGNPISISAAMLREALDKERRIMEKSGKSLEKFDRMVVIGHSMGGLLVRHLVSRREKKEFVEFFGQQRLLALERDLSPSQLKKFEKVFYFKPYPSVKRVVYIAAPHRGATMAQAWYGRLGAKLIRLPQDLLKSGSVLIRTLICSGSGDGSETLLNFNGIRDLAPDGTTIRMLNKLKTPEVPYHSIIGNIRNDVPGNSDGVVDYSSSHLEGAVSELVVKSGHSVQQNSLAIQEIRRILFLHLDAEYPSWRTTDRPVILKARERKEDR